MLYRTTAKIQTELRFAFAGWFGGFVVVECEVEPVFERLVVGDRCGVHKEKAFHYSLGEIHRTRSGSLPHFVGEVRSKRTIRRCFSTPMHILSLTIKHSPPNIHFSTTFECVREIIDRTRSANASSLVIRTKVR